MTDRLDVWGTFGHGRGELTVAQDGAPALEADLSLRTGAFGARGVVLRPAEPRGLELATRADVLLTRTTTDEADGAAGEGRLAAEEADAHRLRLVVEGSREFAWPTGRTLAPSLELGLRRDWGDAETGLGLELGARVGYTDPAAGQSMQGTVRGLLAHEDGDYREWGASGTMRFAPGDAGRGLSLNVSPTWGAAASGVEGLWSRQSAEGLAPAGDPPRSARLAAEAGYGFAAFGTGRVTPYAGAEWAQGSARTYRLGTRLSVGGPAASGLTVTLEAHHQEPADQGPPERSLALQHGKNATIVTTLRRLRDSRRSILLSVVFMILKTPGPRIWNGNSKASPMTV